MPKPIVTDHRYDFRGGRNSAISPDLLNQNELVDATNVRLNTTYGGFTKRTGSQRIHQVPLPNALDVAKIDGCFQWDAPLGKQIVAIANGLFCWRYGYDYNTGFSQTAPIVPGVARTTNVGTDPSKAWSGGTNGVNSVSRTGPGQSSVAAGTRLVCKLGDPNQTDGSNIPSTDNTYTLSGIKLTIDTRSVSGSGGYFSSSLSWEYSPDLGASWFPAGINQISVNTGLTGQLITTAFGSITFTVPGGPANVWIRAILTNTAQYTGWSGTVTASCQVFNTAWQTDNYTFNWITGAGGAQLGGPVTFIPFRASTAGAPLILFIAANNHYWSWDGTVLTQLDPANSAPAAYTIAAYHTRMFATTQSQPKNLFWSKIGDGTIYTTGTKTDGGSALTDFLTGNALIAMDVIGSSLLLATTEAIMRFTGHASDDIVISQDTEGISTEVGVVGVNAIKRYENTCAFMSNRGPYAATETYVQPIGEQLNPDWFALDSANIASTTIEYNRSRMELWFAVPRASDGGLCKTIFSQAVRLNAWQGPWTYPFGISYMTKYIDANGQSNILAGCSDGYLRLMDVQNPTTKIVKDDILYDGTGGVNINLQIELPVIHFGIPAIKKALKWILCQADLPISSNPVFNISFDGAGFTPFQVDENNNGAQDYRVDVAGDTSQGFRPRIQFTDDSIYTPIIYGISTIAYNYQRTT